VSNVRKRIIDLYVHNSNWIQWCANKRVRIRTHATFQTLVVALVPSRLDYGNGYWYAFLPTLYVDSSRYLMRLHRWSFSYDAPTTYLTRLPVSRSASSSRLPCWRIKFYIGLHHVTWVRSSVCLICRVGVVSALPAQIAWSCRHSNCLLLAEEILCCCCSNM